MKGRIDDKFLIASSIAGDEEAFGKIYDKYIDEIYRFIAMRVKSPEEAKDIASEAFLKAWQYVSTSKKMVNNIRALLYRISRNLIIDHYRKTSNQFSQIDDAQLESVIDVTLDVVEDTAVKQELENIFSYLDGLSVDAKEVITMRYVQDLSVAEIANILGKNKGTVRVALHRAKKQLKELLKNK